MKILTDMGCVNVVQHLEGEWEVWCGDRRAQSKNLAHAFWTIGIPTPSARALATDVIHSLEGWASAN